MKHSGEGNQQRRRRPTRRHRRNRLIRRYLVCLVVGALAACLPPLVKYLSPSPFLSGPPASITYRQMEEARRAFAIEQEVSGPSADRPVYPYSVVPGGIRNAKELKWFADHDPVVAAHYAGFDYDRARIVRLELAKTVYVSYRIGNHIYWTRHRIKLRKGEKLITDGKITGRTRCANRVEELPQKATSPSEPPVAKMEQPVGKGTAIQSPPVPYESALLNRPLGPAIEPAAPMTSLYSPFVGGNYVAMSPPPLPEGGTCLPTKRKKKDENGEIGAGFVEVSVGSGKKKKKLNPCGGPTVVPEPGTWVLFASGLGLLGWQVRRKSIHA